MKIFVGLISLAAIIFVVHFIRSNGAELAAAKMGKQPHFVDMEGASMVVHGEATKCVPLLEYESARGSPSQADASCPV